MPLSPKRSGAAVLAFGCAIVSFFVHPVLGFFLGLAAVLLGVIGLLLSVSPQTRGGLMSVAAIVLGVVAMVVKILQGVLSLIF